MDCSGHSAAGACRATVRYRVVVGSLVRYTCGRHIGWALGRMLAPDRAAQVTWITPPAPAEDAP